VLPPYDRVLREVAHISNARPMARLKKHPANVRMEESLVGVVGIEVSVSVAMMGAVTGDHH
jgi:hypothetical protein